MTEALKVFDIINSAHMVSYIRLFSAEYVTLKSTEYESEYIESINDLKILGTYSIEWTGAKYFGADDTYMLDLTTNIYAICATFNKSCAIL